MESASFILFGATGDLAKRKIYPALFNLFLEKKLPEAFSVIGLGRREWSDDMFQKNVEQAVHSFSRKQAGREDELKQFLAKFRFQVLDIGREEDYRALLQLVEQREAELNISPNRIYYLSVGPEFFEPIANNIRNSGLGTAKGWKRLVIEKPFGYDLQSARELNENLNHSFEEKEIYRIDHYLGKPIVQKLGELQAVNPELQAVLRNREIANVQIVANETVGVEERAGYYDKAGAIRDMFQNHLLQLLMMVASHIPKHRDPDSGELPKYVVMESLRTLQASHIQSEIVRGQYRAGVLQNEPVKSYIDEPGISESSHNDTFIAARLEINHPLWSGIPFYIRTGKRLKEKSTRIVIELKEAAPAAFAPSQSSASSSRPSQASKLLVFEMSPNEGIWLHLCSRDSIYKGEFIPLHVDHHKDPADIPEAYENLIFDALRGDSTFFAHWDEVELSWEWVQPVLDAFQNNEVPLHYYEAGTYGPAAADQLLEKDGFKWWFDAKPASNNKTNEGDLYVYNQNY